jgi:hypothetical protein
MIHNALPPVPRLILPSNPRVKWSNPLTRGLVGYWPLSDGGGLQARDIAGGNHGTLVGGVRQAVGPHGRALGFDGSTGYVNKTELSTTGPLHPTQFTLCAWVNIPPGTTGDRAIFGSLQYLFQARSNQVKIWDDVSAGATVEGAGTVAGWSFVCATSGGSGQELAVWLRGRKLAWKTSTAVVRNMDRIFIGCYLGVQRFFSGSLSQPTIFNRVLTPTEIQLLYTKPLAMIDDSVEIWSPPPTVSTKRTLTLRGELLARGRTTFQG